MHEYRRILIVKPSSLGDVVHALPTLSALRERFPNAHIAWLVKREWAALLERTEALNQVWPVDPGIQGWLSQVPALRRAGFDLAVDLQGLFRSGAMVWLTGCAMRVGFANAREGSPWFYTHPVSVPHHEMHAVDRYLLAAGSLGASVHGEPRFCLRALGADREEVAALLKGRGLPGTAPWVAMAIAARWPTKQWPLESFAATADLVQKEGLGGVGFIGGADDRLVARRVRGLMKTEPVDLVGATGVGLLPALLESAALLVTNDSGPMHVAAAVGTPVVALFGPTSPVRTGPYGKGHRMITHDVPCSPCFSRACRHGVPMECLAGISPAQVVGVIREYSAMRVDH